MNFVITSLPSPFQSLLEPKIGEGKVRLFLVFRVMICMGIIDRVTRLYVSPVEIDGLQYASTNKSSVLHANH